MNETNYFQLFGLPPSYAIDLADLRARYLRLQARAHPDNFVNNKGEQASAQALAAEVNSAYRSLSDPIARALHLLSLLGYSSADLAERQVNDAGFLMEQMQLREQLEDATSTAELEQLQQSVSALQSDWQQRFAQAWSQQQDGADQHSELLDLLARMQYGHKLSQQIKAAELK